MFAKQVTEEVQIEPQSHEDIEAAILDPSTASLGLNVGDDNSTLSIQVKMRSGAPWSSRAVADVLLGDRVDTAETGGRRIRPLDLLKADPRMRYALVTNEASAEALRDHEGENLLDFPEADDLPPHARVGLDVGTRADLGRRVLLLTGMTDEVLASRLASLLAHHGHIPAARRAECLRDLREVVRARIRGEEGGRLARSDVLSILVRHGGSFAPTRDMDHYVPPQSYRAIKERLESSHAVIIAGPSGTGKTLTADILELELRRGVPPFEVVGEEGGPGHVRSQFTRSTPILFHLRDPWGGNRPTPGADRWSGELPKILQSAGPDRKFLVTSRSDVMHASGIDLKSVLRHWVVEIQVDDYGPRRLAEIYDGMSVDLSPRSRRLASRYRDQALSALSRPFEIRRFMLELMREEADASRDVATLLADSQIDAVSRIVAEQIDSRGLDGAASAAVVWGVLNARGAVKRDVFAKLGRRLRLADPNFRPDVDGLLDFLLAGQNLRVSGAVLTFQHPRVEEGLRMAFMRFPREAEYALENTVNALAALDDAGDDWGTETGLGVLRAASRIQGLELGLSRPTADRMDAHLRQMAASSVGRNDFNLALRDLLRFGSAAHGPSRLARILIGGADYNRADFREYLPEPYPSDDDIAFLRDHELTRPLIERFIREILPYTSRTYDQGIIALLERLGGDMRGAFLSAMNITSVAGGPASNIEVILRGALIGEEPDYDDAIERFARSRAKADEWMAEYAEDLYLAEEHAVDADGADRIVDEPGERYYNAEQGFEAIVAIRRERHGIGWISESPHREHLIFALAELLLQSSEAAGTAELRLLLSSKTDSTRRRGWDLALRDWDGSLDDVLNGELATSAVSGRHSWLLNVASVADRGDPVPRLAALAVRASTAAKLQLVHNVLVTRIENDPGGPEGEAVRRQRAARLMLDFKMPERELATAFADVLQRSEICTVAQALSKEGRRLLCEALSNSSPDVAGPLACLAASVGVDIVPAAEQLLSTGDAPDGIAAIQACRISRAIPARDTAWKAFGHRRYAVRREALRALAAQAVGHERLRLCTAAADRSADVRMAFALLMHEAIWPEAIEALTMLLRDERNFNSHSPMRGTWSRYAVARSAAAALGAYVSLPTDSVAALIASVRACSSDPFVACCALSSLATRDGPDIVDAIDEALMDTGMDGYPTFRPRAQAAAWALFDRASKGRIDEFSRVARRAAEEDDAIVAAPILLALGVVGGRDRDVLLDTFRARGEEDRAALLRAASIASGNQGAIALDAPERIMLRLTQRDEFGDILTSEERLSIEDWSKGLGLDGFTRYLAWVADVAFGLPLNGELGNVRQLVVPDMIGVMTMRSFGSYGEEELGPDDGS